jgi:gas vesicle protein
MSCEQNDGGMSTLLAFLLGGAVGGVLGLLYAPSSGEETRRRIKFYAEEAADKVVEKVQKAREEADVLCVKVREEISEQKEKLMSALDAGRQAFREEQESLEEIG